MTKSRTKTHEIYTGIGKVCRNNLEITTVRYELVVVEADQKAVWGRITIMEGEWKFYPDDLLVLHLVDGRRQFDFAPGTSAGKPPHLTYKIVSAADGRGFVTVESANLVQHTNEPMRPDRIKFFTPAIVG